MAINTSVPVMTATVGGTVPTPPNNTTTFLRGDGTFNAPGAAAATPKIVLSTIFETAARYTVTKSAGSFGDFNSNGANLSLDVAAGEFVSIKWNVTGGTGGDLYKGSPTFSTVITGNNMSVAASTGSSFFGLGTPAVAGTGHTFTDRHIGFKILKASGTISLYATQANGTTETASSALTTIVDDDVLNLICVVNGTTSVDYYWSKNGGALSSATNLATNLPSGTSTQAQFSASNDSTGATFTFILKGASFTR